MKKARKRNRQFKQFKAQCLMVLRRIKSLIHYTKQGFCE
nr:MAG TPA: hypothetical protein [Caudoviricetes sp.]